MAERAAAARATAPLADSLGALAREMAALMAQALGADSDREARELLAALHDMPRHWAALERDAPVAHADRVRALDAASRRARGEPAQYAVGRAAFRHLTLAVDPRVLIPRPETEQLVELVLALAPGTGGETVVDVGTGSGAIALSLAAEGRYARVIGTDVSLDALAVAAGNVRRCGRELGAAVELRHGSLLRPVPERALHAVVSNPPYVAYGEAEALPASVRDWEPAVALFSGSGGMAATARLVCEASHALAPGGLLALETDARRASLTAELAASHGAYVDVRVQMDLTGRERFVVARRRKGDR